uniref:Uncharacterized protein n=1 Tax=Nelumbo nucifera TaxID=4432 RepID=A0A822Y5Z8_NELNU|nr:TPA_asm: hypothetical protein HUJ06_028519 [Nelumbo nucifera]
MSSPEPWHFYKGKLKQSGVRT